MPDRGRKHYVWDSRRGSQRGDDRNKRESKEGSSASLNPSPRQRKHSSPRFTPKTTRNRRHSVKWHIPLVIKKKIERNGSRVGSTSALHPSPGKIQISNHAFSESFTTYKNPYAPSVGCSPGPAFVRLPPREYEAETQDFVPYREPRYLDLFEPGIHVVRDPNLDQPQSNWKDRWRAKTSNSNIKVAIPSKVFFGFCIILVALVVGIVAIVSISKLLRSASDDPRIDYPFVFTATSCGLVKGIVETDFFTFRGVPYARPPNDQLRLQPSKIHDSLDYCWSGNLTANISRPCWMYDKQGNVLRGDEDCLLLDVFTPKLGYENPLPVIVFLGGVSLGTDEARLRLLRKAGILSKERQVVIVSPQIRRGNLGFLPSPLIAGSVYPHTAGNQGASDLLSALIWVNRNIEHFGGDRNRVTLLGHRAGAALSWPMIHRLSSQKLIQSAWLTGAAPVHPVSIWRNVPTSFSRPVNCSSLFCLLRSLPNTLMKSAEYQRRLAFSKPWLVMDGRFIPMEEEIPRLPLVFGTAEQVSSERLLEYKSSIYSLSDFKNVLMEVMRETIRLNEEPFIQRVHRWREPKKTFDERDVEETMHHYSSITDMWSLLTTIVSDASTTCPLLHRATTLSRKWEHEVPTSRGFQPPVYAYISSHKRSNPSESGISDALMDVEAIFDVFQPHSQSDRDFVSTIQELFFNFIETQRIERHYATSAHNGIYVLTDKLEIKRDRSLCDLWFNRTYLAKRY